MTERGVRPSRLFLTPTLIASLIASLLGSSARGDDRSAVKSLRIRAVAFAPIGKVFSLGEIAINGHASGGEQPIWNGDLLQAPEGLTAQVAIDSVGRVALAGGTTARLALNVSISDDGLDNYTLMMSLTGGVATVTLLANASALVRAGTATFSVAPGSTFRAGIRADRTVLDVLEGGVEIESGAFKRTCSVSVAKYDPITNRETVIEIGKTIKTRKRKRTELALGSIIEDSDPPRRENRVRSIVGVSAHSSSSSESTQQSTRPGANRKLKVELKSQGVGELVSATERGQEVTVVTGPDGKAKVTFQAGSRAASTIVTVMDVTEPREPDEVRVDWHATILVERGFWERHRTKFILGGIAAAVTTVLVTRGTAPLKQEGPPVIP